MNHRIACRWFVILLVLILYNEDSQGQRQRKTKDINFNSLLQDNSTESREDRLFSLFSIVQFRNGPCSSTLSFQSGGTRSIRRNGTCYTASECVSRRGSAFGSCASGFGVCCVFLYSENGATITQNCSYIQNPGYPSTFSTGGQLAYNIQKCSNDVCYLRLDFELFSIQGTAATTEENGGQCLDTFDMTINTNQNVPQICGENRGQHIYLDIGDRASDTASLNFNFNGDGFNRIYDIKVTQIPCRSRSRPPNGCLQYHTGLTGRMETFNFQNAADNHLANQDYSVCIRQENGFCCVEYTPCREMNSFSLDTVTDGAAQTSQTDTACTQDYLAIPASSASCTTVQKQPNIASRFCGIFLNTQNGGVNNLPVCDCTAPFSIGIFTDANTDMGDATTANIMPSRGACVTWKQIPCSGS